MVTLVYSYLFGACALIGTLTRSGIAALLLTVLLWGLLFTLNTSETIVDGFRVARIEEMSAIDRFMDRRVQKDPAADVSDLQEARERAEEALDSLRTAHRILFTLKTVLPKPEETAALVERWLVDAANLRGVASDATEDDEPSDDEISRRRRGRNSSFGSVYARERDVVEAVNRERRSRGAGWIVGTSLGFEAVVILAGCLVFARRDF
jgi:hypothetical protein